jgi:glyoxylase-like metal-dependent hydrolase (beta-lactamase superfamily II)
METIGANIFVETVYPGINVGCIVASPGSICVDTPLLPGEAQRWRARIRSLGGEPVRFVVYTSGHRERILGTQYLIDLAPLPLLEPPRTMHSPFQRPETSVVRKGNAGGKKSGNTRPCAAVLAHKSAWEQIGEHRTDSFKQAMIDMLGERDPDIKKLRVVAPHITCDERVQLHVNDQNIILLAPSKGLLWVWIEEQQVLFAGDTLVVGTHPMLTVTDLHDWLAALERLRREPQFQNAIIVPGRGPLCGTSAVDPLVEYLLFACDKTRRIYHAGRSKTDLNGVAAELVSFYPVADGQRERVQRQIKLGLDELYDTFKANDIASA